MRVQCKACNGVYDAVGADGMQYFHSCPPLSRVELAAAVTANKVSLPVGETVDDAVLKRSYERANKRDENVPSTRATDSGAMKSAGADVTVIGASPPSKVIVP